MLTSKQRANLRKHANSEDAILHIGKGGIDQCVIKQAADALLARELIKIAVLETCDKPVRDVAEELAKATESDTVQIIGRKAVLFKRNAKKPCYDGCL